MSIFDSTEAYAPFVNEKQLGEAVAPFRDQVVLATKFGLRNGDPKDSTAGPRAFAKSPMRP